MWVRGLKPYCFSESMFLGSVAPRVGAWIETLIMQQDVVAYGVAPRVGAWIETINLLGSLKGQ